MVGWPSGFLFEHDTNLWYTGRVTEFYKRNPNIHCYVCKKPIYRRPVVLKRNGGNAYCSQTCYGLACRKEKPCIVCTKPILAEAHKKTCSRVCANKHRAGIRYKMNRPKDKVQYSRGLKIRLLRARGSQCERCGYNKYEILHVHHRDKNRKNNNLSNLELVCPNCHFEEHYLKKSWMHKLGEVA